ncbi:MAG: gliding motility-associated protein GldE [Bacteroidia bacterium]|nr:gliding motility-associated protein GldE [Bacteroidia bacterium]
MENSLSTEPPVNFVLMLINTSISTADLFSLALSLSAVIVLISCSALISGSENAFFGLTKNQINELTEPDNTIAKYISYLVQHPKHLLATILISNTFVNIAIVLVSTVAISIVFQFSEFPILGFFIEVVLVTFILVLFGEVMPKIYASQNNIRVAKFMAGPMFLLNKILTPFVFILVKSTSVIDKRITKKGHIFSIDELTHAIDITNEEETPKEEKIILKSIVNFGNITVKQIMQQRPDITAIKSDTPYKQLLLKISDWGYSRVPIFTDNLDNIIGILFIKDLLPHLSKDDTFEWKTLIRKPYFVPESKKIDDLLKEFQTKRVHFAVVVDEFGGTQGIVTMEDILEEIFGEINDEFDEDETVYSRLNDTTYVFEAKMLINDMCRFIGVETEVFDDIRNDADTLAGMLLELEGELPTKGAVILYKDFKFIIESVDKRRIKRVKVELLNVENKG